MAPPLAGACSVGARCRVGRHVQRGVVLSHVASIVLTLVRQCRDVLDELKVQLEGVVADSSVYVAFYQAKAEYHKVRGAGATAITYFVLAVIMFVGMVLCSCALSSLTCGAPFKKLWLVAGDKNMLCVLQ